MEGKTTQNQERRVDAGEDEFQFIVGATGERVDCSKREIGSKKTGKCHAIRDQKSRQAKKTSIFMAIRMVFGFFFEMLAGGQVLVSSFGQAIHGYGEVGMRRKRIKSG